MTSAQVSQAQLVEQTVANAAGTDPIVFNDFVLKDEQTGGVIVSCAMHEEWAKLCDKHRRWQLLGFIECAKTQQIAVGRVLYELGRNPELRTVICCNTQRQAAKILGQLADYIEKSPELRRVFPHLRPDPNGPWNNSALTVVRKTSSKDPSVQAIGVHANVLGSRTDLLIADDLCDYENSRTVTMRDDLDRWLRSTLLGRLTADSRAWILGNVFHRDDQYHRLEGSGWTTKRYAVEKRNLLGQRVSRWPERWPPSRIEEWRKNVLGAREAARQLDCTPPDDACPVFDAQWVHDALRAGENAATEHFASETMRGDVIVLGVDVAFTHEARTSDESALVLTRTFRSSGAREVTQVSAGHWTFDALVARVVDTCRRHKAIAAIETNGGGQFVAEQVEREGIPVERSHVSATARRTQVEMLSSELGGGRWSLRQPGTLDPEMKRLAQETMAFSYEEHCGDRLSAWLQTIPVIRAREQRRKGRVFKLDLLTR